jgi:hypothetical protein
MGHTEEEWEAGPFMTRIAKRVSGWSRYFSLVSSCVLAEGPVLDASASASPRLHRAAIRGSERRGTGCVASVH